MRGAAGSPPPAEVRTTPWPRPAAAWAGPDELGRGIVLEPGAEVPAPWAGAPELAVGPDVTIEVANELARCWATRTRFVARWSGPPTADDQDPYPVPDRDERTPWDLGVGFELTAERVAGLLRLHAVDARSAAAARYRPAELAVVRRATPIDGPGPAELRLADGTAAVVDGGPLVPVTLAAAPEVAVVPAALIEAGRLRPLVGATTTAELAADQLAAVGHLGAGARIIAPAGSGKTRVLTERARLLLAGRQVPPSLLTLVAFNVRAAEEMRSRTTDLPELHIRTLNSLGLAIANGSGPFAARADGRRLATIDETDVRRILEGLVRFPRRAGTDPAAPWLEALAAVRLGLRQPAEVEAAFGGDVDGLAAVLPAYRAELDRRGALDYDEQIVAAIERLVREPAARRRAQQVCRVLLVDEFQDLAPAHLLLVRLLSAPTYDCFGVGDDDQTIYGYAGASPDWLVRFGDWFPGSADHPLQTNYRCPPAVVAAAASLLTRNRHRVTKEIHAAPGRAADPAALVVHHDHDVAAATCAEVERLVAGGVAPADIAVLTRVNVTLLPVQLRLAAAGIATTAPSMASCCRARAPALRWPGWRWPPPGRDAGRQRGHRTAGRVGGRRRPSPTPGPVAQAAGVDERAAHRRGPAPAGRPAVLGQGRRQGRALRRRRRADDGAGARRRRHPRCCGRWPTASGWGRPWRPSTGRGAPSTVPPTAMIWPRSRRWPTCTPTRPGSGRGCAAS
ncbi:MAG: ATP-dependent helicase [Acidimicrobiales bacterium]